MKFSASVKCSRYSWSWTFIPLKCEIVFQTSNTFGFRSMQSGLLCLPPSGFTSKSESVLTTRLWSTPVWCVLTCLVSPGALVRPVSNRCVGDLTPHFKRTLDNQSSPTFQIKEHHQHPLGQNTLISRLFELTITGLVTISFFLQNSLYGKKLMLMMSEWKMPMTTMMMLIIPDIGCGTSL